MAPSEVPLVVFSEKYVSRDETTYAMRRKNFSVTGSYHVRDSSGDTKLDVDDHMFSAHDTKTVYDKDGNRVAVVKKKLFSIHGTWKVYSANGHRLLASIVPKLKTLRGRATVIIHRPGGDLYLTVQPDCIARNFKILLGGTVVASVQRSSFYKDIFNRLITSTDTYSTLLNPTPEQVFAVGLSALAAAIFNSDVDRYKVLVKPNVDQAFAVVLAVIFDAWSRQLHKAVTLGIPGLFF